MARARTVAAFAALAAGLWFVPSTAGGSRNDDPASLYPDAELFAIGPDSNTLRLARADDVAAKAVAALP